MPKVRIRGRRTPPSRANDAPVRVDEVVRVTPQLEDILPAYVRPGAVTAIRRLGGSRDESRNPQAPEAATDKTRKHRPGTFTGKGDPRNNMKGRPPAGTSAAERIRKWGKYSVPDLMWMRTIPWLPSADQIVISGILGASDVNSFGGGDTKNRMALWDRTDGKPATTANVNANVNASFTFGDLLQSALSAPDEDEETDD